MQTHPPVFRSVIAELTARFRNPFVLLSPTSRHMDAHCEELLAHVRARLFDLKSLLAFDDQGNLCPLRPPAEIFACLNPGPSQFSPTTPKHTARFALRKGYRFWHLTFEGEEAYISHERGMFYVAYLLTHPHEPIHALDLIAKIPELYRHHLGLPTLTDPATGKAAPLLSGARLQERSLALDDREAMRRLYKKQKELEAILDDDSQSEPVKSEALRELEELIEFQRQHGRESKDSARASAKAVRTAIQRLHSHLSTTLDSQGRAHPVLASFAPHLERCILTPSTRYSGHGGPHARAGLAGCFVYEQPHSTFWSA
jgi:hypothetical protein